MRDKRTITFVRLLFTLKIGQVGSYNKRLIYNNSSEVHEFHHISYTFTVTVTFYSYEKIHFLLFY